MNAEERARRTQLWRRYVMRGEALTTVASDLAAEFDVDEATVRDDLSSIDDWLPRLDVAREVAGFSLLAEVRANRQQLHQLAEQARDAGDYTEERKIREEINRSANLERRIRAGNVKTELTSSDKTIEELSDEIR